ncbi:MAG: hypothetical protein Q7R56_02555, partial [Nanoarchaeota archaeon]|nr:hypothetical protein [Nanoarchaeota archaeon]
KGMGAFLANNEERLILVTRQHWFPLAVRLLILTFGTFLTIALILLTFSYLLLSYTLVITATFVVLVISINLFLKSFVDWYFHLYIVTTHKILEACYTPLFSHVINEVLLDQVRCTEVDIKMDGIVREIIDMGNIMITFDRPTHQEEFCLTNIRNPQKVGILLGDVLGAMQHRYGIPMWNRTRGSSRKTLFTEDVFSSNMIGVGGGFA